MSSQRIAKEHQEAKELGGCTFKPDFSKTQEISRRYLCKKKVERKSAEATKPTLKKANKKMLRQFVNCHKKE